MAAKPIIIVEDNPGIGELIRLHVEREGFSARLITSGLIALKTVKREQPELIILDLMLPDLDGLEICRRLKWEEQTRAVPILIVSAKGEEADIVAGLELGADDYVTKPFSPKVLMARMRNILRRYAAPVQTPDTKRIELAGGELVIDLDRHQVIVSGEEVDMTPTEFSVLRFLAARPSFVRTRDQILSSVHGDTAILTSRTIDVHVTAIRRKLGELGQMIKTVRGVGYRLEEPAGTVEL